jgi:hypothetical protein
MDVLEFADWQAFHRVEPWGEPTLDERTRILASVMVNSQGGDTTPRDFDFSWDKAAPERERVMIDVREGLAMLANSIQRK